MESHLLARERQQLRALLEQYSDISKDLPNLKADEPLAWMPQLQE